MISGIINLKKEAGMTSHDAVFKLRKILHEKKIGHGGTLDPDVTGVLQERSTREKLPLDFQQLPRMLVEMSFKQLQLQS